MESGHGGSFFLFWRNRGGEGEEDVVETKAAEEGEGIDGREEEEEEMDGGGVMPFSLSLPSG